mgnify:CR=1 FL=1
MESKCTVLFFDEIDALGQSRGGGREQSSGGGAGESCSRRVLAELLIQLNQISNPGPPSVLEPSECERGSDENASGEIGTEAANIASGKVIVVAATNRPSDCDPALLRRFGIRVHVGLPKDVDRRRILKRLLKGISHSISKVELSDLALALEGWSGSELERYVQ